MFDATVSGLLIGLGLILAIGAQNAFVLRQGLRGEHVLLVCTICALSDATLIVFGVTGFREIVARAAWLEPAMRIGGSAFLVWFGLRSLASAWRSTDALVPATGAVGGGLATSGGPQPPSGTSARAAATTVLALTWLNPHVYLDTVVMLGTISTRFPGHEGFFALGAVTASFAFFFTLGFGARLLRPLFARPAAWRVLEAGIGVLMLGLAAKLLAG